MKIVHRGKKQGTKLDFSPKLMLRGVSPPVLDFNYLPLHLLLLIIFIKPCKNKILPSLLDWSLVS
jgi:hypothetical protein